jgi:hypothetical protein
MFVRESRPIFSPFVRRETVAPVMMAGHKKARVKEYYETGTTAKKMRGLGSVQSECPRCSASEGGSLSKYSKEMKAKLKDRHPTPHVP